MKSKRYLSLILAIIITTGLMTSCEDNPQKETEGTKKAEIVADDIENKLKNPNATREARLLYNYILEIEGNSILSGQQESFWNGTPEYEMSYISDVTGGKLPAIRGLDFINNSGDNTYEKVVERSLEWWEKGGIVSICWHWGTPPDGVGYDSSKGEIDLDEALTEGTDLYNAMVMRMDEVALELLKLQEAGVPVLWRPFHEFDGAWFWWGKGGPDNFIKLWQLMYDRYTNYHGLNNLIWVLGYSHSARHGWYPGSEYVDISGADSYDGGTQVNLFKRVRRYIEDDTIPLAYHECGAMPNPDSLDEGDVDWVWFLTWTTTHIKEENTAEEVKYIYNHDYVITLDELPNFKAM